jgi:hypothetical protein
MAVRRHVSLLDSSIVHVAPRRAGYPGDGTVISPVRAVCGVVLQGELVDTSGRPISCPRCRRELGLEVAR